MGEKKVIHWQYPCGCVLGAYWCSKHDRERMWSPGIEVSSRGNLVLLSEHETAMEAAKGALSEAMEEINTLATEVRLTAAMCDLVIKGQATMRMDGDRIKFTLLDRG